MAVTITVIYFQFFLDMIYSILSLILNQFFYMFICQKNLGRCLLISSFHSQGLLEDAHRFAYHCTYELFVKVFV